MPIYEYRCENGHTFEVQQRMTDDPVAACQTCAAPVQRVFHPVAVHFKGKGFYSTDYGSRKRQKELTDSAERGANEHDEKMKKKRDDAAKADPKPAAGEKQAVKPKKPAKDD